MFQPEIFNVFCDVPNAIVENLLEEHIVYFLKEYTADFMEVASLEEWIRNELDQCLKELNLKRSYESFLVSYEEVIQRCPHMTEHIARLKTMVQPEQRTAEWYAFRYNHITASNAWKAYSASEKMRNSLIYEKCKPYEKKVFKSSLTETPMSWGHKYEPLSATIYEALNQTKISDFGCIEHPVHTFLAASPDGICTGPNNYGRMIEIKNVVSREITGIPKPDYYVQMQIQMEVCDLDECDFVETKFVEYENYEDYKNDGTFTQSADGKQKGIIKVYTKDDAYRYEYMPLNCDEVEAWLDASGPDEWIKNVYWKLAVYSCVYVPRCKLWFDRTLNDLEEVWKTVLKERADGSWVARQPTRRAKKTEVHITGCEVAEKDYDQLTY